MKISESFPTKYISATDLAKVKNDTPFVIKELKLEENMNPRTKQKESKLVVYFRGVQKAHRVRKSESQALIAKFGDDSEAWIGMSVKLCPVQTKTGPGVRMMPYEGQRATGQKPREVAAPTREPGEDEMDLSIDENEIPNG